MEGKLTISVKSTNSVTAGIYPRPTLIHGDNDVYTEVFHCSPVCKSQRPKNLDVPPKETG